MFNFVEIVFMLASTSVLFRSNSIAIKLVSYYARKIGSRYLYELVRPLVEEISSTKISYEVDPSRMDGGIDMKQNFEKLITLCEKFLGLVTQSLPKCPMYNVFHFFFFGCATIIDHNL